MSNKSGLRPGGRVAFLAVVLLATLGISAVGVLAARPSDLAGSAGTRRVPGSRRDEGS